MRAWFLAVLVTLLAPINAAIREPFKKYDAAAIRRFDDELRHLGIVLPSLSKPENDIDLPDPVVSAAAGDFEGYWTKTQFGRPIAAFEGIPYAQPPVGPLRFKVAQPLTQRLDHFVAKAPGSMCYQRNVYIFSPVIEGQEDCLFINIYAPERLNRSKNELLPVMFWIHGGGFLSGEGALYQPNILLDRDVVLATINYRLGPLGFLTTEDGTIPGNLGLKDQVAALRWVRDNIAAFGGNPNLVTVFGQSAGGASTEFHRMSPLSRGLFHRSVSISGQTSAPWALAPPGETKRHRDKAAKYWKCPTQPSSAFLKCLNSKSGEDITGVDYQFMEWGISPFMPFKPVIEGDVPDAFLPFHPNKHYADGIVNDVPYMMGLTSEEGGVIAIAIFNNATQLQELNDRFNELLPKTLFLEDVEEKRRVSLAESIRRAYFPPGKITKYDVSGGINIYTDFLLFYPVIQAEQRHKRHAKSPLYTWLFSYEGQNSYSALFGDRKNRYGACHGDDLMYLFSLPALFGDEHLTPRDVWMSIFMTEVYTNFARDGVPSSSLMDVKWKPTTGEVIDYLHIQGPRRISMQSDMLPERWRYVEEVTKEVNGYQYKDEL